MQLSQKALISLWTSALLVMTPFLLIVFGAALAELMGCDIMFLLSEVCIVGEINIARVLYGLSLVGWLLLVGLPVGLILAPVCSIWWWYSMRQERMVRASGQTHI